MVIHSKQLFCSLRRASLALGRLHWHGLTRVSVHFAALTNYMLIAGSFVTGLKG